MSIPVTCESCGNRFRVPDASLGRVVGCPKCSADVRVPDLSAGLAPPSVGMGFQADYEPAPPSIQPPSSSSLPTEESSLSRRRSKGWGKLLFLFLFLFGGCCLSCGGCGVWVFNDSKTWRDFEAPGGRFRVQMPGRPQTKNETITDENGKSREIVSYQSFDLSEQTLYVVAHTDFPELKPEFGKKRILFDDLTPFLEQGLDQFRKDLPKGATERHRQKILFGPYEGREVVYDLPNKQGVAVARFFVVKKRAYFLAVAGPKLTLEHPHISQFFDSIQLTNADDFVVPAEKIGPTYQRDNAEKAQPN